MSKKRQTHNQRPTNALWGMLLAGALVTGSLAAWVQMSPNKSIPVEEHRVARLPEHQSKRDVPTTHKQDPGKIQVLKPRFEGQDLKYDRHEAVVPEGQNKMVFAVNQYLKESKVAPAAAQATKASIDKRGDLTLEFNSDFDRTYGTEDERTLVDGILRTLGQFSEINSVRFTINGQQMETLGNIDLTTPQAVLRD